MSKESTSLNPKPGLNKTPLILTAALILILGLAAGGYLLLRDSEPPLIAITPDAAEVGRAARLGVEVSDAGSGLKRLVIVALQDGREIPLADRSYSPPAGSAREDIDLQAVDIAEGTFTLRVTAQDASLALFGQKGLSSLERTYTLDATPPVVTIKSPVNNLNRGGSGFMVYALSEPARETGIRVGERFFPAHLQPTAGPGLVYYCLYAMPWDTTLDQFKPVIAAEDAAGNRIEIPFYYHANPRDFRRDTIVLSDSFMERTLPEFQGLLPDGGTPLERYLYVNSTLRQQSRATLAELSRQTEPTMLWDSAFLRLPNAANRAGFADARDYLYQGRKVDFQTHLGLDLASVKNAPVPAGNDGRVVYADFLGIYGNLVVIDHGLGLQSLYAHLSEMDVKPGDRVVKGQIIGKTGTSGLAGGDHLHFGITVAGLPVQPIEWWDATWIQNNVTSKLP